MFKGKFRMRALSKRELIPEQYFVHEVKETKDTKMDVRPLSLVLIPFVFFWVHVRLRKNPEAWFDEAATLAAIDRTPGELFVLLQKTDLVHAAYYYTVQLWSSVLWLNLPTLRLLSVLVFALTIAVSGTFVFLVAKQNQYLAAHISMLTLAVIPSTQWYAIDARGYVFTLFFFALALLCLKLDLDHSKTWLTVATVVSTALATVYSLMFILAIPVLAGFHLWQVDKSRRRQVAQAYALSLVPLGIFAYFCLGQIGQVGWIGTVQIDVWETVTKAQYFTGSHNITPGSSVDDFALLAAQWLFLALVVAALARRSSWTWCMVLVILVPTLTLVTVHESIKPLYQARYVGFTALAVAVLVGLAVSRTTSHVTTVLAIGFCVAQLPALEESSQRVGKFGETYNSTAALRCQVDTVYYGDWIVRSLVPVEKQCVATDPTPAESGASSGTLFGVQREVSPAEIRYSGRILALRVVQAREWINEVEATAKAKGCKDVRRYPYGRFTAVVADCSTATN